MNRLAPNPRSTRACDNLGQRLPPRGRLLTRREAQELLAIGPTSFWRLVQQEKLRLVSIGLGHRRVDGNSLADLIEGATASTAIASE